MSNFLFNEKRNYFAFFDKLLDTLLHFLIQYLRTGQKGKAVSTAPLTGRIFKEGVDIMLTRYREYRKREKKRIERAVQKAREEAREEGRKEGYDAGYKDAKSGVDYHVKGAQGTRH